MSVPSLTNDELEIWKDLRTNKKPLFNPRTNKALGETSVYIKKFDSQLEVYLKNKPEVAQPIINPQPSSAKPKLFIRKEQVQDTINKPEVVQPEVVQPEAVQPKKFLQEPIRVADYKRLPKNAVNKEGERLNLARNCLPDPPYKWTKSNRAQGLTEGYCEEDINYTKYLDEMRLFKEQVQQQQQHMEEQQDQPQNLEDEVKWMIADIPINECEKLVQFKNRRCNVENGIVEIGYISDDERSNILNTIENIKTRLQLDNQNIVKIQEQKIKELENKLKMQEEQHKKLIDSLPIQIKNLIKTNNIDLSNANDKDAIMQELFNKIVSLEQQELLVRKQYEDDINNYKVKLQELEDKLNKNLEDFQRMNFNGQPVQIVQEVQQANIKEKEYQDEIEKLRNQLRQLNLNRKERKHFCHVLDIWKNEQVAFEDLRCDDNESCNLDNNTCEQSDNPNTLIVNDKAVLVKPSEKIDQINDKLNNLRNPVQVQPPAPVQQQVQVQKCMILESHDTQQDLQKDLQCDNGLVCDIVNKQCVPETPNTNISYIQFLNGDRVKVTGDKEQRKIVIKKIEEEIKKHSQQYKPVIKHFETKPIDINNLIKNLNTIKINSQTFINNKAIIADDQIRNQIAACLKQDGPGQR